MEENWPSGKNYLGEKWEDLAEWNAGTYGGGASYLTETSNMRESQHDRFIMNGLNNEEPNYAKFYPKDERNDMVYAALHQDGVGKMPVRKWHPNDFVNYTDFRKKDEDASLDEYEKSLTKDDEEAYQEAYLAIDELDF